MSTGHNGNVSSAIVDLSEPDILSTQQYLDGSRGGNCFHPEQRLMLAVLLDAVECFQKRPVSRKRKPTSLFLATEAWIFEDDWQWPFSFVNICEGLGVDPAYLRKGLHRWKTAASRMEDSSGGVATSKPRLKLSRRT